MKKNMAHEITGTLVGESNRTWMFGDVDYFKKCGKSRCNGK